MTIMQKAGNTSGEAMDKGGFGQETQVVKGGDWEKAGEQDNQN